MAHDHKKDDDLDEEPEHKPEHDAVEHEDASDEEKDVDVEKEEDVSDDQDKHPSKAGKLQNCWRWALSHKKFSIPAAVVVLVAIFFAVPFTRYSALGLFMKQDFSVLVVDSQTGKPVSSALVSLKGQSANTDGFGKARLRVPVGTGKLAVSKTHFKSSSQSVVVPIKRPSSEFSVKLEATGRPIPVTVLNVVSRKPIAGAVVASEESQAKTDDKGQAILVVPADKNEIKGTLSAEGYNNVEISIKSTTEEDEANTFTLTPSGKIYFLSNQSGKIDVVKSDLDGKNRQTVLAGTGKELKGQTVLLATRDWKYLALQSRRDGGEYDKLFLINTADDSLSVMDEGQAAFSLLGWSNHNFVYKVTRTKLQYWQTKREAIKSYAADKKDITLLDELGGVGNGQSDYTLEEYAYVGPFVLEDEVLFVKDWSSANHPSGYDGKQLTLNRVKTDGTGKKVVQVLGDAVDSLVDNGRSDGPYGAVFGVYKYSADTGGNRRYFVYYEGKVTEDKTITEATVNQNNYTYLISPDDKYTFWSEFRDGKNTLFVGNNEGEDGKEIASKIEHQTYGWYSENYLLVSKDSSELYILPVDGSVAPENYLKITDYFKPDYTYRGYGGGYGGL